MCVGGHGVHTEFGEQLAGVGSSFLSTTWAPGIELRATTLGLCHFCFVMRVSMFSCLCLSVKGKEKLGCYSQDHSHL